MSLNISIIQGRLGKDIEIRRTGEGIAVASFSLAVDRPKDKNGNKGTDWLDVVAWRNTAEFAEKYFHRGDSMIVKGRLQKRDWTDNNGTKRYATEIVADSVEFCGSKQTNSSPAEDYPIIDDSETLPF